MTTLATSGAFARLLDRIRAGDRVARDVAMELLADASRRGMEEAPAMNEAIRDAIDEADRNHAAKTEDPAT